LKNERIYFFQADVDKAVNAAKRAFDRNSEWRKMDGYIRGQLMNKVKSYYIKLFTANAKIECILNANE